MIEYKTGDILSEDAEALVNTVNCVGIMGRGIAFQFKKAFPGNFKAYASACKHDDVKPGRMFIYETGSLTNPHYIINFPTKRHWRAKSKIEDIESGLVALVNEIESRKIESIAIPPLGCGLGGLDWGSVRPLMEKFLSKLHDISIVIFEPGGGPARVRPSRTKQVPKMTPGRAALIGLMDRYIRGLLDPNVTLLEVHKLMYFMQEAGEPLRLKFTKAIYGPYAENLRHVLSSVDGHFITGFENGDAAPDKQLKLVPCALEDANLLLKDKPDTRNRFYKVSRLVEGFESPFGLEL
ncbi:MAG: macro domain-containing protein [Candidatus Eisenbacteria bacterium]|uniref:Macro domain-containing protein n=1 Tax=Eiseniibacteriota bacterium TaxID=2212470 RepID=A0A948WDE1_UNCEI|nr:macro domain-containing protein [Candidatus Eisenbacteria bacterium]MBU2691778.1 macro domain-containing protein [Candidatus Eisenbacteria bacterium]